MVEEDPTAIGLHMERIDNYKYLACLRAQEVPCTGTCGCGFMVGRLSSASSEGLAQALGNQLR